LDLDTHDGLTITYKWPAGPQPPALLAKTELIFWAALPRIATREHVRPARATVTHLPAERRAMEDYLGTRLRKGDYYTITFTQADASRPFLTESDQMWRIFGPRPKPAPLRPPGLGYGHGPCPGCPQRDLARG
jgi:hypothetical protein